MDSILQLPVSNKNMTIKVEVSYSDAEKLLIYVSNMNQTDSANFIEELKIKLRDMKSNQTSIKCRIWNYLGLELKQSSLTWCKYLINEIKKSDENGKSVLHTLFYIKERLENVILNEQNKTETEISKNYPPAVISNEFDIISKSEFSKYICTVSKKRNEIEVWEISDSTLDKLGKFTLRDIFEYESSETVEITNVECAGKKVFITNKRKSAGSEIVFNDLLIFNAIEDKDNVYKQQDELKSKYFRRNIFLSFESKFTKQYLQKDMEFKNFIVFDKIGTNILIQCDVSICERLATG